MKQNISRRLLPDTVSGDIDQYIQEGLVFHLDGLEKGPTEGAWTDRVEGRIYAIRIYNRRLTAAEMLHNQAVDHRRFLTNT